MVLWLTRMLTLITRHKMIELEPGSLEDLKQLYKEAVDNQEDTFYFNGALFSAAYAKYIIELTEKEVG